MKRLAAFLALSFPAAFLPTFGQSLPAPPASDQNFHQHGLTEAAMPGRELRAICWLEAYLSEFPKAPDAAAAQSMIAELDKKNQANVVNFIQTVQDGAVKQANPDQALAQVVDLWLKAGQTDRADQAAALIIDSRTKIYAEVAAAQRQSANREIEDSRKTLADALRTANATKDPFKRVEEKEIVGEAQARSGDITSARRTAATMETEIGKELILEYVSQAQIDSGDIPGALSTANSLQVPSAKDDSLMAIGEAYVRAGNYAEAKCMVTAISGPGDKSTLEGWMADAQAEAGKLKDEETTVQNISDPDSRTAHLQGLAVAKIKAGDMSSAKKFLQDALTSAAEISNSREEAQEQSEICAVWIQTGDLDGAKKIAASIADDAGWRSDAMAQIAGAESNSGNFKMAEDTLSEIHTPYSKDKAMSSIAQSLAGAGKLDDAEKFAKEIQDPRTKGDVMRYIEGFKQAPIAQPFRLDQLAGPIDNVGPPHKPSDVWIGSLKESGANSGLALNTPIFLDFEGYVKTLPADEPAHFAALLATANKLLDARISLDRLRQIAR